MNGYDRDCRLHSGEAIWHIGIMSMSYVKNFSSAVNILLKISFKSAPYQRQITVLLNRRLTHICEIERYAIKKLLLVQQKVDSALFFFLIFEIK